MALVLLYIQAERIEQAEKYLESVSDRFLRNILLEYWQLLFDTTAIMKKSRAIPTFSELSGTLVRKKPILFAEILARLIAESVLSLQQVLQVFLDYLPSRLGRDGHDASESLQYFLEIHFYIFFEKNLELDASCYDVATTEAFKILIRSYLSKLTQKKVYCKDARIPGYQDQKMETPKFLFANYRPHYLDEMPPFAKEYQQTLAQMDRSVRVEIIKLQALLTSGKLPIGCTHEVNNFLDSEEIDGSLSIRILCFEETYIPTKLLVAAYPQAVLQYAKRNSQQSCT
ncbi:uncharacterized protein LOC107267226 isoform X1 [Cephus cinctus]|uniref:Uncharacterized protein LOC107267226 isoform X1 n=1 Tax=Cephus cinctus TaxID=211228 RepID=A0AAJ7RGQ0_CEPCN|nr:uncharacterized protein LOC107267226 isoform X1 [Cephus cinctus]